MQERSFRQDLTGSDESLDDLLARLKADPGKPRVKPRRNPPRDGHLVTSRWPRGGSGGAEAPLPKPETPLQDCFAT